MHKTPTCTMKSLWRLNISSTFSYCCFFLFSNRILRFALFGVFSNWQHAVWDPACPRARGFTKSSFPELTVGAESPWSHLLTSASRPQLCQATAALFSCQGKMPNFEASGWKRVYVCVWVCRGGVGVSWVGGSSCGVICLECLFTFTVINGTLSFLWAFFQHEGSCQLERPHTRSCLPFSVSFILATGPLFLVSLCHVLSAKFQMHFVE